MKEFTKPDLNAPRFRSKKHNILNKGFYKAFREKYPKYSHLTDKEIKQVIVDFNGRIWETVIDNRDGIELPEQLGNVLIGSYPKKVHDNTNYYLSGILGYHVQNTNFESDQYVAKIYYTNSENKYNFKFHELWGFTGVRDFKRSVAKVYPTDWKKYILMDNKTKVSRLFRKAQVKEILIKEQEQQLATYDEFDFS